MTVDRWVEIPELFNFRDMGGVGAVRPGMLYRTDALCSLLDEGRAQYEALGVHTVIDLRRPEEVETQGRAPEWAYQVWHNVTLREPPWPAYTDGEDVGGYLARIYLGMTEAGGGDIVRALSILADPGTGPAIVHCAGGRDRTGVVIALLLDLLEVPDEEIAFDYAMSAEFTRRWLEWKRADSQDIPELPPNLLYTPAAAMTLFLGQLRERHGSVGDYLRHAGLPGTAAAALRLKFLGTGVFPVGR